MNCGLIQRHLGAFVDGELDPATQIAFEKHLDVCSGCQEFHSFEHSFRHQVRDALRGVKAPPGLRERVSAALAEAGEPGAGALIELKPLPWRHAGPLVAAAVAMLIVASVIQLPAHMAVQGASLLDDVVTLHKHALPSDVSAQEPMQITNYFQDKLGFPVKPAEFEEGEGRLVGARLSNVHDHGAAALFYDVHGVRVTVVVFDAPQLLRDAQRVQVAGHEVLYHNVGGRTVPVRQHQGLNYAFFGDMDREALMHLAATARVSY